MISKPTNRLKSAITSRRLLTSVQPVYTKYISNLIYQSSFGLLSALSIYMKLKISVTLLALSLIPTIASAQFSRSSDFTIVSTSAKPSAILNHDHYICLGKMSAEIDDEVFSLKKSYPYLFKTISIHQDNCFAPAEVSENLRGKFDSILEKIDTKSGDYLKAFIPEKNIEMTDFQLRNQDRSLGRKILRAELLIGGAELAGMGILIALPKSVTKWEDGWVDDAKSNLKRAWTKPPVWDKDHWSINYIGHPYAGALYYNALRSQGATRLQSFIFSTVQSTIWEYGLEAFAEQPSTQDLFITPLVGSFVGELAHLATLRMRRNGFTGIEKVVVTVINPSYVLNNGFK